MNVLGFDTSTAATSACLLLSGGRGVEVLPETSALGTPPAHTRELMPVIQSVLERAGLGFADVDAVAVGVGPGTFTGLRIGIATARALAHAHRLELRPVSSLRALAEGIDGSLRLPLLDAKRGELFAALYEREAERWAPFVAAPEEVARRVGAAGIGPVAAGDGSIRFRAVLEAAGVEVEPDGSPAHLVRGLHVCRLGALAPVRPPEAVLPEYLRVPDARPQ